MLGAYKKGAREMSRLRLRQWIVAVALGWYLLTPHLVENPNGDWTAVNLPIAQWNHSGGYDTASACEDGKMKVAREAAAMAKRTESVDAKKPFTRAMVAFFNGVCISSDDPRLRP